MSIRGHHSSIVEQSGLINKTSQRMYHDVTYLTSSVDTAVTVAVVSALPLSSDAKITVQLVEPDSPAGQ